MKTSRFNVVKTIGEEHDQNRHYKNGRSSFDDICQNIEKLLKLTDIKLYLQVGVDNYDPIHTGTFTFI